ncbi:hypothetical protein BCV70DRAFT_113039, partial [Testicularia cyperi]
IGRRRTHQCPRPGVAVGRRSVGEKTGASTNPPSIPKLQKAEKMSGTQEGNGAIKGKISTRRWMVSCACSTVLLCIKAEICCQAHSANSHCAKGTTRTTACSVMRGPRSFAIQAELEPRPLLDRSFTAVAPFSSVVPILLCSSTASVLPVVTAGSIVTLLRTNHSGLPVETDILTAAQKLAVQMAQCRCGHRQSGSFRMLQSRFGSRVVLRCVMVGFTSGIQPEQWSTSLARGLVRLWA